MTVVDNPEPAGTGAEESTSQDAADSANVSQHYFMTRDARHKFSNTVSTV